MSEFYAGTPVNPPAPVNQGPSMLEIEAMISARVQQLESAYDAKIKALETRHAAEMKAARGVPPVDSAVPTHGAGPGNETAETWSQYHQELSRAGKLTEAHVRQVTGLPPLEGDQSE